MKYEVTFKIAASQGGNERKVEVDVIDQGSEQTNQADAIITASLVLDAEKIDRWSLVRVAKVTS